MRARLAGIGLFAVIVAGAGWSPEQEPPGDGASAQVERAALPRAEAPPPLSDPVIRGAFEQGSLPIADSSGAPPNGLVATPMLRRIEPAGADAGTTTTGDSPEPRAALSSAWTYQGQLKLNGVPVTGAYDMQFTLLDDASATVAGPICRDDVQVTAGLFTVELDFSPALPFATSENRHLRIEVRSDATPANCGAGAYTTLSPPQKLNATPYAMALRLPYSATASSGVGSHLLYMRNTSSNDTCARFDADSHIGVWGHSNTNFWAGVYGTTATTQPSWLLGNSGVSGWSAHQGVAGLTDSGIGVFGWALATTGPSIGVCGRSDSLSGYGVKGEAASTDPSATAAGVYGIALSNSAYAGYFDGRGYFRGNVGIGENNPAEELVVSSNDAVTRIDINNLGSWNSELRFRYGDSTKYTIGVSATDDKLHFRGTGSPILTLTTLGQVGLGIGSSNPDTAVLIGNSSSLETTLKIANSTGTGDPQLQFSSGGILTTLGNDNDDGDKFKIGTTSVATNTRLTIDGSGNVGIGTTSPQSRFQVASSNQWSWSLGNGWGDFNIGNGTYGLAMGVALGGGGAGTVRIWPKGDAAGEALVFGNPVAGDVLSVNANGVVGLDQSSLNNGNLTTPALVFGSGSGEGIASKRTAGGNQFGLDFYTNFGNRMSVTNTGNVGIGRQPTANRLEVEGNASKTAAGSWLANSDARIKRDIRSVSNALATLDRVRLVAFRYSDGYRAEHPDVENRPYLNVVAQEFAEVFPDYVKSSGEKLANGGEILQVDTHPLTIYSAAAIQELHAELRNKDREIVELRARLDRLERAVTDSRVGDTR